jgi:lipopolysaccharide export system permease protein
MSFLVLARRHRFLLGRLIRRAVPVPFGWHTRYLLGSYCRQTILVTCAILTIALSIDLTFYLSKVLATISQWQTSWVSIQLARYVVLRGTDFLAELLPLASFFGVFWAEVEHTFSRERLIVWLSGRTPQQCLLPVLLFGIFVGSVQLALNYYLRPLAVMAMAQDHLGFYGERFDPRPQLDPRWAAAGRDLIQAIVEPGDPPSLRDVKIYRMNKELSLQTFFRAKAARPVKAGEWLLTDGYQWSPPQMSDEDGSTSAKTGPVAIEPAPFAEKIIDLDISPIWISNDRVNARYLTKDVFSALGKERFFPDFEYRTWEHARWSLPLFCIAMPFLATNLSLLLLARKIAFAQLAIIAAMGYLANALMKVFILLGEHGHIPAVVAGWLIPVMTLAVCFVLTFLRFNPKAARGSGEELVHATHDPETGRFFTVGE